MSVQYLLPCTQCETKNQVSPRHAGGHFACEQCGAQIDVPKLGALKQLEVANAAADTAPREQNRTKGLLFSIGLILAVLAGIAGGALYTMGNQRSVSVDVESQIEDQLAQFDNLTPAQLLREWRQRPTELGSWKELDFIRLNREGDVLKGFSYILLSIAGVGLLCLCSSFLISSKNTR